MDDPSSTMSEAMFLEAEYELPMNVREIERMSGNVEGRVKRNANTTSKGHRSYDDLRHAGVQIVDNSYIK